MTRHYQPKTNNPYRLEHDLYMQMFYKIRRYPTLIEERDKALYGAPPPPDGMPNGKGVTGNPTEKRALILMRIREDIEAIEQAMIYLRDKYRDTYTGEPFDPYESFMDYGAFCYYRSKKGKNTAPCERTWKRYRSEFAYIVAKKLNYF